MAGTTQDHVVKLFQNMQYNYNTKKITIDNVRFGLTRIIAYLETEQCDVYCLLWYLTASICFWFVYQNNDPWFSVCKAVVDLPTPPLNEATVMIMGGIVNKDDLIVA